MRAITIVPRKPGSLRLDDIPDPAPAAGDVLVRAVAVGICGTDRELVEGVYGEAPAGLERLVLGHESLGRVLEAPAESGFARDDLVVGVVRTADPVPCAHCAAGEWDMCSNGRYTEHGIKGLNGFAAERFRIPASMLVRLDPALGRCGVLLEPASVLAKAWEQIERIGRRTLWTPRRALVVGAGPVGLMAALMGRQRGLEVHVQDHNDRAPKPQLVRAIGARYFASEKTEGDYDIVVECTGAPEVVRRLLAVERPNSITCLTGLSAAASNVALPVAPFNQSMVLTNGVVFGTVNANLRHYRAAADSLARADRAWLERVITRVVPLAQWESAYERRTGDVKTVLSFAD
ncbi:MAG: glucose 1-dehydrogenase [Betaproteobacteria bacterium]|nr:glucose 1-dehydrogenase [Betaproteobacteria bacterium]